jgi:NAD(P)-dependent dehydrogenase (short-subunit alcohol dehydrogenase family)/uncharacterized OB-fold protein/putative sterol carrier protein
MFVNALQEAEPGDRIVLASFGQGCDALLFEVTERIKELPSTSITGYRSRVGIKDSLENKKNSDSYLKYLKFNDLIETESGIRSEAPDQTAMTTLWRKRKMITALVGGKCTQCGTPQYPKMNICVNPECGATNTQEDYEFADVPATVKSYTGDMLAYSIDPPAIYGMVQFEGGGRFMADFTDCVLEDLQVGMHVEMVFRQHYVDDKRGYTGYFWKAVPAKKNGKARQEAEELPAEIRFDDQVAVVTGAGGGLGRTYALELARRGAKVVVNDLGGAPDGSGQSTSMADNVVDEITAAGGTAIANYDSVASLEGGQDIIQSALDSFGRIDILINNAGILRDKSFAKMTPELWQDVLDVHLQGAFNVTQPAFKAMRQQGYGRIVMTSSAAGLFGNFGQTNYAAAKLGIVGLMHTLKLEGQKYNIKVNTVAPLATTRLTEDVLPPDLTEKLDPELVAPLVIYLCSNQCTDTGLILNAGMGFFSRAGVVSGIGAWPGEGDQPPGVGDVHRNWEKIASLRGALEYPSANAALMDMLSGPKETHEETPKEGEAEATGSSDPESSITAIFDRMPELFQPDAAAGVDVVFQFNISGTGGGDWIVIVKENACSVEAGQHDNPVTTLKMESGDFIDLVEGSLPAMQAYTSGKLIIEGDLMKSQLVQKLFKFG